MHVFRKLVSSLLLLCLAVGCTRTVSLDYKATASFSEAKAKPFDPSKHTDTLWERETDGLTVSETGEIRVTFFRSCYLLIPENDHFAIFVPLYRTLTDDEPAFTVPAGTAQLCIDGDIIRFQVESDPLHCFAEEQTNTYFQRNDDASSKRYYTVDNEPWELFIQSQPNTEWENWYCGISNGPSTKLSTDPNGAASGTIYVESTETECELLIGHHGWNKLCAIVKKNPRGLDDVLLFGKNLQTYGDRDSARQFGIKVSYDPKKLLDERSGDTFHLYSQVELADPTEKNWIGMNLYEYFYWMEKDGWQVEEIQMLQIEMPCIFRLRKANETILVSAGLDYRPVPFGDYYVEGYVRYTGRKVQSWAGYTPKDNTIAENYTLRKGQSSAYVFGAPGYSPSSLCHFYFLDDCRVVGIQTDYITIEDDKIEIYDALTGEIN